MAFTTVSTIESVEISFSQERNRITRIEINFDGTNPDPSRIVITFTNYNANPLSQLETLQDIWASDAGIVDENDNPIDPVVNGFPFGDSIDHLVEHGYWNPLDENSWDLFVESQKYQGFFLEGLADIRTPTGRRPEIRTKFGRVPEKVQPPGGTYDFPFEDTGIGVLSTSDNNVRLSVVIPATLNYTSANVADVQNYQGVQWVKEWFSEHFLNGTAIVDGELNDTNYGGTGRRYRYHGQTFVIVEVEYDYIGTRMNRVNVEIDKSTSGNLNRNVFQQNLDNESLELPTTHLNVNPVEGALDVDLEVERVKFSPDVWLGLYDNVLMQRLLEDQGSVNDDRHVLMPLVSSIGRLVNYDDLVGYTIDSGSGKLLPFEKHVHTIHFTGTADSDLLFNRLFDLMPAWGQDKELQIHNKGTGDLSFVKQNGDEFFKLKPKENCEAHFTLNENGAGEILLRGLPHRYLNHSDAGVGNQNTPYWSYTGSTNGRLRWLKHSDNNERYDTDAFLKGARSLPSAGSNQGTINSEDNYDYVGAFQVLLPGELLIELHCAYELDSASGSLSTGNGIWVYKVNNNGSGLSLIWDGTRPSVSGSGAVAGYDIVHIEENMNAGQWIFFMFRYSASSSNIWNDWDLQSFRRKIRLSPEVEIEV